MQKEIGWIILVCAITAIIATPVLANKKTTKQQTGAALFANYCASCHSGGGNIVKPKHPIIGSEQLNNILVFKTYLSAPPGHMPYYQHIVKDKKKLESLYNYCKATYKDRVQKQSSNSYAPLYNTAALSNQAPH